MSEKWIYLPHEGSAEMRDLLGGKGANLCEMWNMGLPVPPFFIATTKGCIYYKDHGEMPPGIEDQVREGIRFVEQEMERIRREIEKKTGNPGSLSYPQIFNEAKNPLLVSVRSGAKFSMPGMMDTVLNIGLNKKILEGLIEWSGNRRFSLDCYRRLLQMYGDVVLGVNEKLFEEALKAKREKYDKKTDPELEADALEELAGEFEAFIRDAGRSVPTDPWEQLMGGIEAVFKSWNTERAKAYRNANRIPHTLGTAVNVQAMVFGNIDDDCGSGVLFSRNPSTGEDVLFAELLFNAQGEEVVAGIRTPLGIGKLKEKKPVMFDELSRYAKAVEDRYRDMQDMEFTFEGDRLWVLQTRNGKRTGPAAVRIACEMVDKRLISVPQALDQVDPALLVQCLLPRIKEPRNDYKDDIVGKGLNASPGAAVGQIVFSTARVLELIEAAKKDGKKGDKLPKLILVRDETNPNDFPGMNASQGVLTSQGGMTSHAAVVARQMGKPCVAGCRAAKVDLEKKELHLGDRVFVEMDILTLDGSEGEVIARAVKLEEDPKPDEFFWRVMEWADACRRLGVRANADKKSEAALARFLGAEGIGLCRTEHQFGGERKMLVAELILILTVTEPTEEQLALKDELLRSLLDKQREDFLGVFEAMDGLPTTIRLIDPPLHEFLPSDEELEGLIAGAGGRAEREKYKQMAALRKDIHEANPMLGLRGCRLGILYPVINEVQVQAIFEAACMRKDAGHDPRPEIMIPLTADVNELRFLEPLVRNTAAKVMKEKGVEVEYLYGTMIEIPRAALTADEVAEVAEFFSFGTNDLTQTCMGLSRDDTAAMLKEYVEKGILPVDPFQVLDRRGVGRLMRICIEDARKTRPDIKLGICGEHGGEPESVAFCHEVGLDYVSCSTYRVPGARLAAAQAVLRERKAAKKPTNA